MTALAPLALLESLPKGIFHHHFHLSLFHGAGRTIVLGVGVVGETIGDVRSIGGDPKVLCGRVHPEEPRDFDAELAATMVHNQSAFTFGYELTIDVVWEARLARDGRLTEVTDRLGTAQVRSTRKVFRRAQHSREVVLLCNSDGTAIADEKSIPDAALVARLREVARSDNGTAPPK